MITPEQLEALTRYASEQGRLILEGIASADSHVYADVAIVAYMYYAHTTVTLKNTLATAEQRADMIAVIAAAEKLARAEYEGELKALDVFAGASS